MVVAGRVLPRRVLRDRRASGSGNVTDALRAGPALEPARLERRLHLAGARGRRCPAGARGTCSCARCSTSSSRWRCRWRSATRSPTTSSRHARGAAKALLLVLLVAAVLDLVPDADVRAGRTCSTSGGYAARVAERALDRLAVRRARAARRRRLARRAADRGDHGARLRLRAVPDPAAVRVAGPDRPAADRGRARPRRARRRGAFWRVVAAALEGRDARRASC